jgi:hypothetical protein
MAEIVVTTLRGLLEADVREGDTLQLAGDRWSLNIILYDLADLEDSYELPPAPMLLRLAAFARTAYPFDWLTALDGTEEEATPLIAQASEAEHGGGARSVFLAPLLEILAYSSQPWLLDGRALERIHAALQFTWSLMQNNRHFIVGGSLLLRAGCALYAATAAEEMGLSLLTRARGLVENEISQERGQDLPLHEVNVELATAICQMLWDSLESRQPLTRRQRCAALYSGHDGDDQLSPYGALGVLDRALTGWRRAADRERWPPPSRDKVARAELAQHHLRLVYDFARDEAQGRWPSFPYRELERLADEYLAAGLSPVCVLCSAVTHIAICIRRRPDQAGRFEQAARRLSAQLENALARFPVTPARFNDAARCLVGCFLFLRDQDTAKRWISEALRRLAQTVEGSTDKYTRSYFFRDCEDWLGYAYLASFGEDIHPGRFFDSVYRSLYGLQWSKRLRVEGISVVQVSVSRPCILFRALAYDGGTEISLWGPDNCFVALEEVFDAARKDLEHFEKTKQAPASATVWAKLADRLMAHLHFNRLHGEFQVQGVNNHPRLLVETQGNGLHIPWCGLFVESPFQPEAMLVADLSVSREKTRQIPEAEAGIAVLNCFTPDDPLDVHFQQFAGELGARHVRCADPSELRAHLQAEPNRLIIVAGHGWQDAALGVLRLQIGANDYDAEMVWEPVTLARGSILACFTCYGGGGKSAATGEFGSIASLGLRAGARAVVASRWPAWVLPETAPHYRQLFEDLAAAASDRNIWRIGASVMAFMRSMRGPGLWNSLGWGVYVAGSNGPDGVAPPSGGLLAMAVNG